MEIDPGFIKAYNNLAVIYNELGRTPEAVAACKKAIAINPNYAFAYYNLGRIYERLGRSSEAEALYKKAAELNPALTGAGNSPEGQQP